MARPSNRQLAYKAIERETLSSDRAAAAKADIVMDQWMKDSLPEKELKTWAARQREFKFIAPEQC